MYDGKQPSRSDIEKKSLKNDVKMNTFFSNEKSWNTPSLACNGKIRSGVKVDILPCLKMYTTTESSVAANTSKTHNMCTPDNSDIESAEPEGAQIILTVSQKVDG